MESSVSQIQRVLLSLDAARKKVSLEGGYSEAIKDYEVGLKALGRLVATCDDNLYDKLTDLRSKLHTELTILYDLNRELSSFGGPSSATDSSADDPYADPDVWPPPTPVPGGRNGAMKPRNPPTPSSQDNLPAWARARDQAAQNRRPSSEVAVPARRTGAPSSSSAALAAAEESAAARLERMRKERDSAGFGNRPDLPSANNALMRRKSPTPAAPQRRAGPVGPSSGAAAPAAAVGPSVAGRGGAAGGGGRGAGPSSQKGGKGDESKQPQNDYESQIMSEMLDSSPGVKWDDIAGLAYAKQTLQEAVILPNLRPDLFVGLRSPPKGVLLFGPPGTGKTLLAKAVATESGFVFFSITASSVMSKYFGEGEKLMKALFSVARANQPAVIFFDEIDSLMSARKENEHEASRRLKTEFMTQVDGATTSKEDRLLIMAATNIPWELDEAVLRRLVKRIYVPLPDDEARKGLIQHLMLKQGSGGADIVEDASKMTRIVQLTQGYSGSDLSAVCHEAAMGPIRELSPSALLAMKAEDVRPLTDQDFAFAVQAIRPSVSPESLEAFSKWAEQFGVNR